MSESEAVVGIANLSVALNASEPRETEVFAEQLTEEPELMAERTTLVRALLSNLVVVLGPSS